ncbi:MAG: DUF6883 domain-containing protein [Candidatus Rokuibacteriota bacterium]
MTHRSCKGYCLSTTHPRGRHKARLFAAALGLRVEEFAERRDALAGAASEGEAQQLRNDEFGARYVVEFELVRGTRRAVVRSYRIVRRGETSPRFVTCHVV